MQSQYCVKNEDSLKRINEMAIRDNRLEFVGTSSLDHFYHLSMANGIEATIAIYDLSIPPAGIVAPVNVFGNPRDKDVTKNILETIFGSELIEVVP